MRLGQLARKLGTTQGEILAYLEKIDRDEINNSNSKIEEELEIQLIEQFKPDLLEVEEDTNTEPLPLAIAQKQQSVEEHGTEQQSSIEDLSTVEELPIENLNTNREVEINSPDSDQESTIEEIISQKTEIKPDFENNSEILELTPPLPPEEETNDTSDFNELQEEAPLETAIEEKLEIESVENTEDIHTDQHNPTEDVEVIRVKKVKLEGIKVVGKIDLPEPKIKVEKPEEEGPANETSIPDSKRRGTRNIEKRKTREGNRKYNNREPESFEQKLRIEKRKNELKLNRDQKILKSKKKKYYLENVQSQVQIKPSKKVKKKTLEKNRQQTIPQKPRNIVRRFWGWLNGEFDQF